MICHADFEKLISDLNQVLFYAFTILEGHVDGDDDGADDGDVCGRCG